MQDTAEAIIVKYWKDNHEHISSVVFKDLMAERLTENGTDVISDIKEFLNIKKKTTKHRTHMTQRTAMRYLSEFWKGGSYDQFTEDWYERYRDHLDGKGLTLNTVSKTISILKTFLNYTLRKGKHNNRAFEFWSTPGVPADSIYLNEDEISLIANYESLPKDLEQVRDLFIIACKSSARFSDMHKISRENTKTIKGAMIASYYQAKTSDKVSFPLTKGTISLLDKYDWQLPRFTENRHFNDKLREVCRLAGINTPCIKGITYRNRVDSKTYEKWELVSSHTARRSFATNAFLAGVDPMKIRKMMGRKSEKDFLTYVKASEEDSAALASQHPFFD